ncbi:hypothetical protein VSS86_22940, partial [Bacillus safensis]|uniref:hypothetical protein n=1 Tax=Bacillus safensis TaxID=561879 RepID=UPI002DD446CD
ICQWELSTPTDISIPLTHRLVLRALEAGECLSAFKICFSVSLLFFPLPLYHKKARKKRTPEGVLMNVSYLPKTAS